jgi:hypothetical protein
LRLDGKLVETASDEQIRGQLLYRSAPATQMILDHTPLARRDRPKHLRLDVEDIVEAGAQGIVGKRRTPKPHLLKLLSLQLFRLDSDTGEIEIR